jgi:hypothetical protein
MEEEIKPSEFRKIQKRSGLRNLYFTSHWWANQIKLV